MQESRWSLRPSLWYCCSCRIPRYALFAGDWLSEVVPFDHRLKRSACWPSSALDNPVLLCILEPARGTHVSMTISGQEKTFELCMKVPTDVVD